MSAERSDGFVEVDCDWDLYAFPGATIVTCPRCGTEWNVADRRMWLLRSAEDTLLSATDISRAVGTLTPEAVRGYALRKRLLRRGERTQNGKTIPLYRLGDVLDILARQAERATA